MNAVLEPLLLPTPAERVECHRSAGAGRLRYYLFVPSDLQADARVLVAVHGVSRRAGQQARAYAAFAERHGMVVVAPRFSSRRFPRYQRLRCRAGGGVSPVRALHAVLDEVAARTGTDTHRLYLAGHSGGGQFVHRYAMLYPRRCAAVAVGAAGWYTLPEPALRWPLGIDRTAQRARGGRSAFMNRFLRVPMAAFVGEQDLSRAPPFNTARVLDRQQGPTRVDRARTWVESMRAAAAAAGLATRYRFELLPDCGHDFGVCARRGGLAERVGAFLLDIAD